MLVYKGHFPLGIRPGASFTASRRIQYLPRRLYTSQSTGRRRPGAPSSKRVFLSKAQSPFCAIVCVLGSKTTFRSRVLVCSFLIICTTLFVTYQHGLLRNYGFFHKIIDSSINRLITLETIEPLHSENGTIYRSLTQDREIRLLIIEPGAPGEELNCHLVHAQLSWKTKYEALSYCWGDGALKRQISCSHRNIDITANLYNALSDLRDLDKQRILWVDQLCINQQDDEEKKKQVQLMTTIYSQALQVLIYLGKPDTATTGALESIRYLDQRLMPLYIRNFFQISGYINIPIKWWDKLPVTQPIPRDDVNWDPIVNLLHTPWFQRTWIIQEAVLPKNGRVILGNQSVPWPMFERVIDAMVTYRRLVENIPGLFYDEEIHTKFNLIASSRWTRHSIKANRRILFERLTTGSSHKQESPKLLDLIASSRSFGCSNPRDKVYGMLGVTRQNTDSPYLAPEYSIFPGHVYRNFVLWDIFENHSLRALGISSEKAGGQYASPSWVPNFNELDPCVSLTGVAMRLFKFDASAGLPVEAWLSGQDNQLHLRGRVIDTIHTVGKEYFKEPTKTFKEDTIYTTEALLVNADMLLEAKTIWLAAIKRSTRSHEETPKPQDLFAKELRYGRVVQVEHVPSNWKPFLRTLVCSPADGTTELFKATPSTVASFVRPIVAACYFKEKSYDVDVYSFSLFMMAARSRRFSGTNRGRIGYVPKKARVGDLVVIFNGAKVPHIIRKRLRGGFYLIGECYMDGIMYGEEIKEGRDKENEKWFALV